jgi:ribosomal protein S7
MHEYTPKTNRKGRIPPPNSGKIDHAKLHELILKGLGNKEIADILKVNPSSITRARKRLDLNAAKTVQMVQAEKVVYRQLSTWDQLQKINADAHEVLEQAMVVIKAHTEVTEAGKGTNYYDVAMKAMARIESQLKLQNETLQLIANMKAIVEFRQELIRLLGEVDAKVREEFLKRLREKRIMDGLVA